MNNIEWLESIKTLKLPELSRGNHTDPESGLCAMEMVAFMERLDHSDSPPCTCPVIAAFVRKINDRFGDEDRQKLLPYLPRLVGTVNPDLELKRAEYLAWQACHVFAPSALRAAGLDKQADALVSTSTLLDAAYSAANAAYAANATNAAEAACDAAYAANAAYAAYAADAAAYAAYAADAAADAANAAYAAADAAANEILVSLDGLLNIGVGDGFTNMDALPDLVELATA